MWPSRSAMKSLDVDIVTSSTICEAPREFAEILPLCRDHHLTFCIGEITLQDPHNRP